MILRVAQDDLLNRIALQEIIQHPRFITTMDVLLVFLHR